MNSDTAVAHAVPGLLRLRPAPAGLPATDLRPPVVAESGDPFTLLRVVDLLARLERGQAIRLDNIVGALNAAHLDWLFSRTVVADALIALQANWMADYRNIAGFEIGESEYGDTLTIEDSTRVDPWIVNQANRAVAACREALVGFARLDRIGADA
jgi:hypothetical protein